MIFETWAPLIKARKAKGVENWQRLQHVADKLVGKKQSDITFTSAHPMYEGEPVKHTLGSSTGNQHFLMGYVSPGFHVAPYHWQIIDPYITDEEAKAKEHPSRVEFWKQTGLPIEEEGDTATGSPHSSFKKTKTKQAVEANYRAEAVFAKAGYGKYIGIPSLGIVFGVLDKRLYTWELVKGSFLAAINPEFFQAMEAAQEEKEDDFEFEEKPINKAIITEAVKFLGYKFVDNTYDLVKSRFPSPGSIIDMKNCFGIVTDSSVDFFTITGDRALVDVFDKSITSVDLTTSTDVPASVILNFMHNYLDISREDVQKDMQKGSIEPEVSLISPTLGSEHWDFNKPSTSRDVELVNGTLRVVNRT